MTRQKLIEEIKKLKEETKHRDCALCRKYGNWVDEITHFGDTLDEETIELVHANLRQHTQIKYPLSAV